MTICVYAVSTPYPYPTNVGVGSGIGIGYSDNHTSTVYTNSVITEAEHIRLLTIIDKQKTLIKELLKTATSEQLVAYIDSVIAGWSKNG